MIRAQSWPWWRWILIGLNTLALVLSAILSWHYLKGGSMIGCGGGSPCEQILNSQWSTIAGTIPVSGLAMGLYLAILIAGFFIGPETEVEIRRIAWSFILVLAGSVAGSAIWFTILQIWVIGDFCPWCMTTHITGLLLAVLVIWRVISDAQNSVIRLLPAMGMVLIGLFLAGILVTLQVSFTPSGVYQDGESQLKQPVIDYNTAPMVGSPDAPYVITLLFDYQCSHCQKIHFMLNEAVSRYDGKLAFVLCPTPLNTECNPYVPVDVDAFKNSCELAKIGLAVWLARRELFPDFENFMFTFDSGDRWQPRSLESAKAKAIKLIGQDKFDDAWTNQWISQYLQSSTQIYGHTIQGGRGGIPKLINGSHWVIPEPNNADDLIMIMQESLALPKP